MELQILIEKVEKTEPEKTEKNGILPNPFPQSSELKNGICFDVKTPKNKRFLALETNVLVNLRLESFLPFACFAGKATAN